MREYTERTYTIHYAHVQCKQNSMYITTNCWIFYYSSLYHFILTLKQYLFFKSTKQNIEKLKNNYK